MDSLMPNRGNGVIGNRERLPVTLDRGGSRLLSPRCAHLSRLSTRFWRKQLRQPAQVHDLRCKREEQFDLGPAARHHQRKMPRCLASAKTVSMSLRAN